MNGLINLLCSLNINNADVLEYTKRLKNIQIKKGEHFQMQGCPVRYMGYVDSGKFRYYKIDKDGNERTLWFNKSFPFIGDYHSFLKRTNAELCIQAMEDYEITLFSYEQMMELFDTNIDTQKLRATIAERSMFGWRNIALALYFDTAEERYIELLKDFPDIEKEISLKHICLCSVVCPSSVSRISIM